MKTGDVLQLKAAVAPDNATNKGIQWSSNNTRVATVNSSSGIVTAQADGNAIITATALDGGGAKDSSSVTVSQKILVDSVTLSNCYLLLKKGDTLTLEAHVSPENADNKAVRWTSSDETVATVSGGVVTAKKAGTTTITCTATDGSGKFSACEVSVVELVTSIEIDPGNLTMQSGDSEQWIAYVHPYTASNKNVLWVSSDESVVTVTPETSTRTLVTANAPGCATITVKATDGSNVSASCDVTGKT